jgi:ubiquinone/menaquinone biosynthesis C-methylase UbiE
MSYTDSHKFYDKVAKKFGNYSTEASRITKYETENPEEVFKNLLIKYSGKDKNVLDLGCADGRFTIVISSNFKKVVAIDLSKGMLKAARLLQKKEKVENVSFEETNAFKVPYRNNSFDIIYSRRGPTPFNEIYRLLKKDGYFINIEIGEKDTQELKEVFGRGQNYGKWNDNTLQRDQKKLKSFGFELIFGKDYFYVEYYPDHHNLDLFLQGVPIFTDYDSEKDRSSLEKYISVCQTKQGIALPRHRIVIVAQK